MSLTLPTLSELRVQAISVYENAIGQDAPVFAKAFIPVLATTQALFTYALYKFAGERILQNLAISAGETGLENLGVEYGVTRTAAKATQLEITLPAVTGTIIPINTVFFGNSNGLRYYSNAEVEAAAGVATIECTCDEAGVDGNLLVDDTLTLSAPITDAENTATITEVLVEGLDQEDLEVYRRKVLDQIQTVGGGSNLADYRNWAQETTGVNRAFPYAGTPERSSADFVDHDMEETGTSAWLTYGNPTVTKETGDPYEGLQHIRIERGASAPFIGQKILTVGVEYTLSGVARGDGTSYPEIYNSTTELWEGTSSTDWQSFEFTFTAEDEVIQLHLTGGSSGNYVDYDDLELLQTEYAGNVTVYVECTEDLDADGIPDQDLLDETRAYIQYDQSTGKARPSLGLTDENLFVEPIIRTPIYVEIRGLDIDAELEDQAEDDIEADLDTYLRNATPYIQGLDSASSQADQITDPLLSQVVQDILNKYGATCTGIGIGIMEGVFLAGYSLGAGELAKLGGVTYVE